MSKFVHLHTHSHYSLLEALPKIPDMVKRAKDMGQETLALTDAGNLYGAIEFYQECKKQKIKPIIGLDAYVALRTRHDKEPRIDNQRSRLVLLARNETGYKNLIKLVSASYLEGFYYKPRIDQELMEKYSEGLVAILPSFYRGDTGEAAERYKKIYGDKLYLEITHHPEIAGHSKKMRGVAEFSKESGIPLVAAHDTYYLEPGDRLAHETLLSIQSHLGRESAGFDDSEEDFSFISSEQAEEYFKDMPEALENTAKVAEMCNLELDLGKWVFPNYVVESGKSYDDELRDVVYRGLGERGVDKTKEVTDRIEYELGVIRDKGFSPYFLIVGDLLDFARREGILSNIRGSVMGSIVTYLAGITNVNPLDYNLPFERFLNPDRPKAPDIDMDFADTRRDEVIDYAREKYGADKVAQIGTFGTMMARGAVRDVTRALGFPYALGDQIAKMIPLGAQGFPMTIDRAMNENPELKKLYDENADAKSVLDMAKKIEGCARHISVHAAGVVISPKPLVEYTPLQYDTKGEKKIITQYDMYSITDEYDGVGLTKFDFLGLKNLSIIADAIQRIKIIENKDVDILEIPLDDKKTFGLLSRGETEGTFQLNGDAMTKFLMELKPTTIHDIHAMVALYRPGPMQFIPLFIERKHKPELVTYMDPALKPILERTYGILVYQDDLLLIAHEIAGYTWGELDKFRKAVGKKIHEEMAAQKEKFITGCVEHSKWPRRKAEDLWAWIEPFAAYGFNKAHSVSYGHVAYQTAWLKANYPEIYMSAVLSADSGDVEKIGVMIAECKKMGIEVLPPSINESFSQFSVIPVDQTSPRSSLSLRARLSESKTPAPLLTKERVAERPGEVNPEHKYKIRFGLTTIKNFGQGVSTAITAERKRGGKFKSLTDFLHRVQDKNINKKSLESLIKAGALDGLPVGPGSGDLCERGRLLANLDGLLSYHRELMNAPENQSSLFGLMDDTSSIPTLRLSSEQAASQKEKLAWEKELLGLYISGHPLEEFKEKLEKMDINIKKLADYKNHTEAVIVGIVEEARDITTKNNERMVFMKLSDFSGAIEVAIFPRILTKYRELVRPDTCIAIKGKVSKRKGETSFIAEKIKAL